MAIVTVISRAKRLRASSHRFQKSLRWMKKHAHRVYRRSVRQAIRVGRDIDTRNALLTAVFAVIAVDGQLSTPHSPAPITVNVFTSGMSWSTVPNTIVTAELRNANGLKATAGVRSSANGSVLIAFVPTAPSQNAIIDPDDRIRVEDASGTLVDLTVPTLKADADIETSRVGGLGPPFAALDVFLDSGQGSTSDQLRLISQVTTAADGSWQFAFASKGDLRPSDSGVVLYLSKDGHRFQTRFAPLSLMAMNNGIALRSRASLGSNINLTATTKDGLRLASAETQVTTRQELTLPLFPGKRLTASATVTMVHDSVLFQTPRLIVFEMPAMDLDVDLAGQAIHGQATPDVAVDVIAGPAGAIQAGRAVLEWHVVTGSDGEFHIRVDNARDIFRPGWRFRVSHVLDNVVTLGAELTLRSIRVALDHPYIVGLVGELSVPYTISLSSNEGVLLATIKGSTDDKGYFATGHSVNYWTKPTVRFGTGERLEISFGDIDPEWTEIPILDASVDKAANRVIGHAPPGSICLVRSVSGTIITTTTAADGSFVAQFGTAVDLSSGDIALQGRAGFQYIKPWAVPEIRHTIGSSSVQIRAGSGANVALDLLGPDGRLAGSARGEVTLASIESLRFPNSVSLDLTDSAGQSVVPRAKDQLLVRIGETQIITSTVPRLGLQADISMNRIDGWTEPYSMIELFVVQHAVPGATPRDALLSTTADEGGRFGASLSGALRLQHNDTVQLALTSTTGVRFDRAFNLDGLRVDLDVSSVSGVTEANTLLTGTMDRGGRRIATARGQSNAVGEFEFLFADAKGNSLIFEADDLVTVSPSANPSAVSKTLRIPRFEVKVDRVGQKVSGVVGTRGTLGLAATSRFPTVDSDSLGAFGNSVVEVASDGTFVVPAKNLSQFGIASADLRPGTVVEAELQTEDGTIITRSTAVPIVNIQSGTNRICGFTWPYGPIDLTLLDSKQLPVGHARGSATARGMYELALRKSDGQPAKVKAGDTLTMAWGTDSERIVIPRLSVQAAWTTMLPAHLAPVSQISGKTLPVRAIYLKFPAKGCLDEPASHLITAKSNGNGEFQSTLDRPEVGEAIEVATYLESGHRVFTKVVRTLVRVFVGTAKVSGLVESDSEVNVEIRSGDGVFKSVGTALSDSDGEFQATTMPSGNTAILPGDNVIVETKGVATSVSVEPLGYDFSVEGGLEGFAPPLRNVRATVALSDSSKLDIPLHSNASGRITYRVGDLPRDSAWGLGDWRRITLTMANSDGHQMVVEGDVNGGLPIPARARVFLPSARLRR